VTCKGYWCHLKNPNSNFPYSILHFKIQNKKHYRWETTHTHRDQNHREREREWTEKAQKCQLWEREGHEITKSPTKTQSQMKKSTTMSTTKPQRFLSTNKREKKESKKTSKECKNLVSWTFLSSSRLALLLLKELQGQALPRQNTPLPFCHVGLFAVPLGVPVAWPPPPLFFSSSPHFVVNACFKFWDFYYALNVMALKEYFINWVWLKFIFWGLFLIS